MEQKQYVKAKVLTKTQSSLLSKSLLIAAIGFAIIALSGLGFYYLLDHIVKNNQGNTLIALYIVSILFILISSFMAMYLFGKMFVAPDKIKYATIIAMLLMYSLAEGFGFGTLFYAVMNTNGVSGFEAYDLFIIFGIGAAVFLIAGLIGMFLNSNATMSLGKIIMYMSMALLPIWLVVILLSIFNVGFSLGMWTAIYSVVALLFVLYIVFDFSTIAKMNQFTSLASTSVQFKMAFLFGFKLLMDFVGLIWMLIRLYLIFKR